MLGYVLGRVTKSQMVMIMLMVTFCCRLLDDNRQLFVPELQETINPHPHFMLFATQNPPGNPPHPVMHAHVLLRIVYDIHDCDCLIFTVATQSSLHASLILSSHILMTHTHDPEQAILPEVYHYHITLITDDKHGDSVAMLQGSMGGVRCYHVPSEVVF